MNQPKRPKKLVLNKETIRTLSDASLEGIHGGQAIFSISGCHGEKCSGKASCKNNGGCAPDVY